MEKQKNKTERIGFTKDQMIQFLRIMQKNTDRLIVLQDAYMKEQQSLFHEKWKVRYLTRRLKAIDPNEAVSEEELDKQIHGKEN
jgi:hypothetical protein|tara:strand:+ start:154 stop:405 length:252 start_codon:yes stop_codon:yes gene_type:complete